MIVIMYASFCKPVSPEWIRKQASKLAADTKKRTLNYRRWQDAISTIYGRFLLEELVNYFGLSLSINDIRYTKYQKPFFEDTSFNFNISHSGNFVVCAGSRNINLGIDIEEVKPIQFEHFKAQFNLDEWQKIKSSPNELACFYDLWTKKEAILKADGRGLSKKLKEIDLSKGGNVALRRVNWNLAEVSMPANYKCAIAYDAVEGRILIKDMSQSLPSVF